MLLSLDDPLGAMLLHMDSSELDGRLEERLGWSAVCQETD